MHYDELEKRKEKKTNIFMGATRIRGAGNNRRKLLRCICAKRMRDGSKQWWQKKPICFLLLNLIHEQTEHAIQVLVSYLI